MGGSVESGLFLLARPICRDGAAKCVGHVLSFYSHKIKRVCRSILAAECISLANVLDVSTWLKAVIFEVYTGKFRRERIMGDGPLPLFSPFAIGNSGGIILNTLSLWKGSGKTSLNRNDMFWLIM